MYFSVGEAAIEAACQNISQWPRLRTGVEVELPLLGNIIRFRAPRLPRSEAHYFRMTDGNTNTSLFSAVSSRQVLSDPRSLMGWFVHANLYSELYFVLHHLWHIWELIITGQPLLIFGQSPSRTSSVVVSVISLISPLTYMGDYRPYFSIYDASLPHFQALHDAKPEVLPSLVLGVTNPFLLKTFQNFPNILTIGKEEVPGGEKLFSKHLIAAANTNATNHSNTNDAANCIPAAAPTLNTNSTSTGSANLHPIYSPKGASKASPRAVPVRCKVQSSLKTSKLDMIEPSSGPTVLISSFSPTLCVDKPTLDRLLGPGSKSPQDDKSVDPEKARVQINAMVLRKHFYQLTQVFLLPFGQFFEFETDKNVHLGPRWNPYLELPYLPKFEEQEFLKDVRLHVDQFPIKGLKMQRKNKMVTLYRRFLRSPNFIPWFSSQRDMAKEKMRLYMKSRLVSLRGEHFLRLVCHVSVKRARLVRSRAQKYLDTVVSRPNLDAELRDAITDHLRTLDSLLPPPRKPPAIPQNPKEAKAKQSSRVVDL
mmetsp:Transcript_25908/g.36104  ORF Transcript_25908/g.36104 Transcript_25908/m.36104 type:complete len:536 (+) Transcript_25908:2-1609(+)